MRCNLVSGEEVAGKRRRKIIVRIPRIMGAMTRMKPWKMEERLGMLMVPLPLGTVGTTTFSRCLVTLRMRWTKADVLLLLRDYPAVDRISKSYRRSGVCDNIRRSVYDHQYAVE